MQSFLIKKIILSVIIFFLFIALLFYFTSERGRENKEINPQYGASQSPPSDLRAIMTEIPASGRGKKIMESQGEHTQVRYESKAFLPASVTITNKNGCFLDIQNASDEMIIPRLGPYKDGKETGFLYSAIAPHSSTLIDPRYGTIDHFSFYNKNNPHAVFSVYIDPTCL